MASNLIDFYLGKSPDTEGRFIGEIHAWDNAKLEYVHDYIQWLFPLCEPSPFNSHAPVLTDEQVAAFRTDPHLRAALLKSFDVMLAFYGFTRSDRVITVAQNWERRRADWMTPGNHNYRRITRILKSTSILGLEDMAEAFLAALQTVYRGDFGPLIGDQTFRFWQAAIKTP